MCRKKTNETVQNQNEIHKNIWLINFHSCAQRQCLRVSFLNAINRLLTVSHHTSKHFTQTWCVCDKANSFFLYTYMCFHSLFCDTGDACSKTVLALIILMKQVFHLCNVHCWKNRTWNGVSKEKINNWLMRANRW